jgi:hypothetical protein
MSELPLVDEHRLNVDTTATAAWAALRDFVHALIARPVPAPLSKLWGLQQPGAFSLVEETAPQRIVLSGRHRFSRYELTFAVEPEGGGVALVARTWAEFPGVKGRAYRLLVIGSGAHGVVVRRMLRRIARRARTAR